ncbi:MAG: hypothetical protein ACPLKS_06100 [Caldisericum exile]|uniref:hypothetical protein n=1 Tax=Caldisericum exile TaxID=693075 RepID=UPI003C78557E
MDDKIIQKFDRLEELLLMQIIELIELNALIKKLNYISGTDRDLSVPEFRDELEWLTKMGKCLTDKGVLCPVRGIARKIGKVAKEEDKLNE